MSGLKETLDEKRKLVDKKATQYRTTRDEWNSKTKEFTVQRNELNAEVRELIQNVKQQREIREQMNELVREKKNARKEASNLVKKAKSELDSQKGGKEDSGHGGKRGERKPTVHSLRREFNKLDREMEMGKHLGQNEKKVMKRMKEIRSQIKELEKSEDGNSELADARSKLREAMANQEEAHKEDQEAAQAEQEAHDLMLQWNKEVDRQRELAEGAHRELRKSKKTKKILRGRLGLGPGPGQSGQAGSGISYTSLKFSYWA